MDNRSRQQLTVWWSIWIAFQSGIFVIYYFFTTHRAAPDAAGAGSSLWLAGVGPFLVSALLRWLVLPAMPGVQAAFTVFVAGISLAEACSFMGLFLFPDHRLQLLLFSAFGILQFIPVFANRFFT